MSNIKLKNHYWETSGVFDKVQNKTQRELNKVVTAEIDDLKSAFDALGLSVVSGKLCVTYTA